MLKVSRLGNFPDFREIWISDLKLDLDRFRLGSDDADQIPEFAEKDMGGGGSRMGETIPVRLVIVWFLVVSLNTN